MVLKSGSAGVWRTQSAGDFWDNSSLKCLVLHKFSQKGGSYGDMRHHCKKGVRMGICDIIVKLHLGFCRMVIRGGSRLVGRGVSVSRSHVVLLTSRGDDTMSINLLLNVCLAN